MSSIRMTNVSKTYGQVPIISSFSCLFPDRQFVTLLGPSGCGKTTLLRLIAGFEKVSSGVIAIDDVTVNGPDCFVPPEERGIGMVFQSYAVWPHMNVWENVAYPLKIKAMERSRVEQRVGEILEAMGLSGYGQRMPNELSGGQQQRVALGRALASSPRVLLLDEPLSNLDANLRESMRFEIKDMQKRFGITVVYVTHDQSEAMAMSDQVIVLKDGCVQQVDSPMRLYRAPANPFVADFVGKINFLPARAHEGAIEFPGGQRMAYSGEKRGAVQVAVRPGNIVMRMDRGVLSGRLTHVQFLGDISDCRIEVAGPSETVTAVHVSAPGSSFGRITPGSQVWLDFDDYLVFAEEA